MLWVKTARWGKVLDELEKRELVDKTLKEAFVKLYGYTSGTVRHGRSEGKQANIDEADALAIFGFCASFCGYLCRKQRKIQDSTAT